MLAHEPTSAYKGSGRQYNNKSYNATFVCLVCGRKTSQNLNFLTNRRTMVCDGVRWAKQGNGIVPEHVMNNGHSGDVAIIAMNEAEHRELHSLRGMVLDNGNS